MCTTSRIVTVDTARDRLQFRFEVSLCLGTYIVLSGAYANFVKNLLTGQFNVPLVRGTPPSDLLSVTFNGDYCVLTQIVDILFSWNARDSPPVSLEDTTKGRASR